mgnify:CR=1 FL=1
MFIEKQIETLRSEVTELREIVKDLTYKIDSKPMTTKDACEYLNCSRQTLSNRVNAGLIVVMKEGKHNLYRKSDLDNYLANG